ncbi:MAG: uracil-DNA glycosylase family 4 [Planctomycetota bacterium]|jgi:uracil-DNA glycosylase family 4
MPDSKRKLDSSQPNELAPLEGREDPREELAVLTGSLKGHLERDRRRGRRRVDAAKTLVPGQAPRPTAPAQRAAVEPGPLTPPLKADESVPVNAESAELSRLDWTQLRQKVAACQACPLASTRTQTVFADGQAPARILFVGEAPGQDEDEQGIPFVGRSGALLTDIIQKGMGLSRSDVAIANVIKCRPPEDRDPSPAEKSQCVPFLIRQIELINPELIIALGRHAAGYLLQTDASMSSMRGRIHRPDQLGGRKVLATFHPSYLLQSPEMKNEAWRDIQLGMAELGLSRPG